MAKGAYIGIPMTPPSLGELNVGEIIQLKENGVLADYIIVHQGNPNPSMYDSSCNGTWLLRKDCYSKMAWDSSDNDYENSDIHTYLNGNFIDLFDTSVKSSIKQVKVPYRTGSGYGTSVSSGSSGLSTKVFLLSLRELGTTSSNSLVDGATLDYFTSVASGGDGSIRIANYQGSATEWWTRSPYCQGSTYGSAGVRYIVTTGNSGTSTMSNSNGVRPALILPFDSVIENGKAVQGSSSGSGNGNSSSSNTIGTVEVGQVVKIKENGSFVDYIVTHQGNPDPSMYDASCDGTWLLRKDVYVEAAMNSSDDNRYANSEAHAYLNNTFLSIFDTETQNIIKQVKIPYVNSYGYQKQVASGSNGLSTKVFLLSGHETGFSTWGSTMPTDGIRLELFKDVDDFGGGAEWLTAYMNGSEVGWWLRTPRGSTSDTTSFFYIANNYVSYGTSMQSEGYRPAFIVSSDCPIVDCKLGQNSGNSSSGNSSISNTLGAVEVGQTVKINENGSPVEFYVAKHNYENGLNGNGRTLLVRKDCYDTRVWSNNAINPVNTYANSSIDTWLNGDYKSVLDTKVQDAISTTQFYYTVGNGDNTISELSRAVFLLSLNELGMSDSDFGLEGSALPISDTLSIAYLNNAAVNQWTRSPATYGELNVVGYVSDAGASNGAEIKLSYGSRPCFTLPSTCVVGNDGVVVGEQSTKTLGNLSAGDIVKINENGTPVEYIVVNQGNPDVNLYDASCDGTWLLRKYVEERYNWHSSSKNDYENSSIHSYLNGDYLNKFDFAIQSAIKTVKIPYQKGTGSGGSVSSGANGLSTKVFLLGGYEIGWNADTSSSRYIPIDGACLSYFEGTSSDEDDKRIATLVTGGAQNWWTRSSHTSDTYNVWYVYFDTGDNIGEDATQTYSVRPAIIMPSTCIVGDDGLITGSMYSINGSVARKIKKSYIGVPTDIPIYGSKLVTETLTAATITDCFEVTNGTYYFVGSGTTFTTNNGGKHSSTATTKLKAKNNIDALSFTYSYSSEANYDKFTLVVAGTTVANAVSGSTQTKTWSGSLAAGQEISFTYSKDGSQNKYDDKCTFSNMSATYTKSTIIGYEVKDVARRIKKAYIGIGGGTTYREVEYIQSTGTQYIDTGFKPNQDTRVVFSGYNDSASSGWIYGCWASASSNQFACSALSTYSFRYGAGSASLSTLGVGAVEIDQNKNAYNMNGVAGTITTQTFSSAYTMYLFRINAAGTASTGCFHGKLYSCQIYDNGTLVRDFVPVINPNNTPGLFDKVNKQFYANNGTGDFTVGDETGFTHVSGGIARPCWSGGELTYYGTATPLNTARSGAAATTVGNYALFGGGHTTDYSAIVEAYDDKLIRSIPTALSVKKNELAATTIGNYALFGGGINGPILNSVDAYNTSLTRSSATTLYGARNDLAATTVGNYALFGGGQDEDYESNARVDAYDSSLTRSLPTVLSETRNGLQAATVGGYALFAGGYSDAAATNVVDAYDTSLTRSTPTAMSGDMTYFTSTAIKDYALFGGGQYGGSTVNAYDKNLTRTIPPQLSVSRRRLSATAIDNYALFAGGYNSSTSYNVVDVYDEKLTHTTTTNLNTARGEMAAATIGDYALFVGGDTSSSTNNNPSSVVDVYAFV